MANTLLIKKTSDDFFEFTLNGDVANTVSNTRNDLTAFGNELHFKTANGANIIKNQQIYPADCTLDVDSTLIYFSSVQDAFSKLKTAGYFDWMIGGISGGGSGGVDRFDDLLDTFSYIGNEGMTVRVNETLQRLEPVTYRLIEKFTDLDDAPSALIANKLVSVNEDGTALVLVDQSESQQQYLNSVGSFRYQDLSSQITPVSIIASTDTLIANDTEGDKTNLSNSPYGVSTVYLETENAFDFSSLSIGDTIDLRIDLTIETTIANQIFKLFARTATSSINEEDKYFAFEQIKSIGTNSFSFSIPFDIANGDIQNNPAQIFINSDASASISNINYYVEVIRKNINVISIKTDNSKVDKVNDISGQNLNDIVAPNDYQGSDLVNAPLNSLGKFSISVRSFSENIIQKAIALDNSYQQVQYGQEFTRVKMGSVWYEYFAAKRDFTINDASDSVYLTNIYNNKLIRAIKNGDNNLNIPVFTSSNMALGGQVRVMKYGTGIMNLVPDVGVELIGDFPVSINQNQWYDFTYIGDNKWLVECNIATEFNPAEHDLSEFTNLAVDPYVLKSYVDGQDLATLTDANAYTDTGLALKLNIADYNNHFLGKFTSLSFLEAAFPFANAGDYAQVDAGSGSDVVNYSYDVEDGWVAGGSGSAATTTDELPEGSTNLYFTTARVAGKEDSANKTDDVESNKTSSLKYASAKGVVEWVINFLFGNLAEKTSLFNTDGIAIGDSADGGKTKMISWTNFKALFKTIGGVFIFGSGDIGVDLLEQVEVSTSQNVQTSWAGKVIIFTANCTITVPSTLPANFAFQGVTLAGVTITWAITAPKTWLFGTPASTTEKRTFSLAQRGSTDSVILLQ